MAGNEDYQELMKKGDITIFENYKYYLTRGKLKEHDNIYPKKEWTLREVIADIEKLNNKRSE
jgi:hypothetical protein